MARPLVLVAGIGIAVSVVCLSLARIVNPYREWSFPYLPPQYSAGGWPGHYRWDRAAPFTESGDIVTREFRWDGADSAEIDIPGVVHYAPGPAWRVTVKGRKSSVERLRIDDAGRIFFDGSLLYPHTSSIEVRITGPSLERFELNGSGKLILENIAQEEIRIDIRGSGSVQGRGTVGKLELGIFGSGNADLAGLATGNIKTSIFGSGNADVSPTGEADVNIFGSGDVRLHTRPGHLSTRTFGSGRAIQLEPGQDQIRL